LRGGGDHNTRGDEDQCATNDACARVTRGTPGIRHIAANIVLRSDCRVVLRSVLCSSFCSLFRSLFSVPVLRSLFFVLRSSFVSRECILFAVDISTYARRVELDSDRKLRVRNKLHYRFNHWPIWIVVFFIAPGPLTADLFDRGFDARMATWLSVVLIGTAVAGLFGKLPGCEAAPYIIRFTEDRPNPLYRRICYTTAWGEIVAFTTINVVGLIVAVVTGKWRLREL